jgi:hypothetical protein
MARGGKKAVRRGTKAVKKRNAEYPDEIEYSKKVKRTFYIFLDVILLASFSLALYSTYVKDYTRTILFLAMGTLLLIFFIIKKAFKAIAKKN